MLLINSGILTSYVTYQLTQGDPRRFNKLAFAISRYIRLTPQLIIVILCFFLLPLLGDGPLYKSVTGVEANKCFKNWWVDLLYIQTYYDLNEMVSKKDDQLLFFSSALHRWGSLHLLLASMLPLDHHACFLYS